MTKLTYESRYNNLTIISEPYLKQYGISKKSFAIWQCDCGQTKEILISRVKCGRTKSCGCLQQEEIKLANTTHGLSRHTIYILWMNIQQRCYNKKNKKYHIYGERGIAVCKEWLDDFPTFYDWSITHGWKKGLLIDRINPNGNYEPNNCRFVTYKESANNQRNNIHINAFEETKSVSEWTQDERCKVACRTLYGRIFTCNWLPEIAITTLPGQNVKQLTIFGETKNMNDWVKDKRCQVSRAAFYSRIKNGCDPEKALTTPAKNVK